MNTVRLAISLFIVLLIIVSLAGWAWTAGHLVASQALAGRGVLALGMLAGVIGLVALWRPRPR